MHIGLTAKAELHAKDDVVRRVHAALIAAGATVHADIERCGPMSGCLPLDLAKDSIDALVVIGGDGTIFRSVRELHGRNVPIIGVNRGVVGFLAEVDIDDVEKAFPMLLSPNALRDQRSLLHVTVERKREIIFRGRALNEAVIAQGAIARLLDLKTTVQGEALATYRSDGLIIATPTGSTAYSLSAGGPVVHPQLAALILTPLNPHSFSQKPIVLPGHSTIAVDILPKETRYRDTAVSLTLDGQQYVSVEPTDVLRFCIAPEVVTFLRRTEDTFIATLRKKLKWGERV